MLKSHYAECRYAEWHYTEWHYAECRGRPPKLNMFIKLIIMHSYIVFLLYSSIKMVHFVMLKC